MKYRNPTIIVICSCISLFFMLKTEFYYRIISFKWINDYAVSVYIDSVSDDKAVSGYPFPYHKKYMDIGLSIYNGRFRWFLNYPCFTTSIAQHKDEAEQDSINAWTILKMDDKKIELGNDGKVISIAHDCQR
ncbi:hypothetical protein [Pseudocitrobacter cyperus]|uniref:Uncharacterized protein n=1 Tax=Pseudocitrobacter cyperus TaxID=3112843 RepID=A0ABV0HE88_9ENTR